MKMLLRWTDVAVPSGSCKYLFTLAEFNLAIPTLSHLYFQGMETETSKPGTADVYGQNVLKIHGDVFKGLSVDKLVKSLTGSDLAAPRFKKINTGRSW